MPGGGMLFFLPLPPQHTCFCSEETQLGGFCSCMSQKDAALLLWEEGAKGLGSEQFREPYSSIFEMMKWKLRHMKVLL